MCKSVYVSEGGGGGGIGEQCLLKYWIGTDEYCLHFAKFNIIKLQVSD